MTAEELAPFLDPPARSGDDEIEESYIVPALVRFGGSPEIDEQGNLVYRFESRLLVPSSTPCAAEFCVMSHPWGILCAHCHKAPTCQLVCYEMRYVADPRRSDYREA